MGLEQPHFPPAPPDVLAELDQVLALARHPNVAIKLTGACTYSRRPFPYDDLWEPIGRVLDAYGIDRCMWGTDWQRATPILSYDEALRAFRDHWPLSDADRAALLGGTAMRLYGWER
jgi:predicted TIM-barrel fold metal-dependent hydrolase